MISPDNPGHSAHDPRAQSGPTYTAHEADTPKMPGEPPRVQPSRKNAQNWETDGVTPKPAG
ncbi:hypothetical protein GCM10025862_19080 [Arsenicicoccus piscis]|uniref:Uncharacterized protein n=1 Tax=Arsenicicoccus piscis TaxID=673954 RepID=A0ABQ6HNH4_9MICO|nr:hypothetical protein GCM10025862_19080 [Arsenicicoccus piscis]